MDSQFKAREEIFARFHCTIMKMEISILCHVIVKSQLNRDNFYHLYTRSAGEFGEIFPEVMIFPEGLSPREISSLKEIFRRIPRAEGL